MTTEAEGLAGRAAEMVARRSYGKLLAYLAAQTRDVAGAEDALSEAFAAALSGWSKGSVPTNPDAWLLTVARRKAIDSIRRRQVQEEAADRLRLMVDELNGMPEEEADIPDERLALMFACAHPAIESAVRAPLILQTVLGFDAATIASAFLVSPTAMGQRLVRAKNKIRQAGIPFRVPQKAELPERLQAVLDAIYAAFAEGWADPVGAEARRRNLATEAIWLGRLVVHLLPAEPEGLGLLALMLHAEARRGARRDENGDYVPLEDQATSRWDGALIDEAEMLLHRASGAGVVGRYQLEAAVQSAHVVRRIKGKSDWVAIVQLYDGLAAITRSPVVAINRAVALAHAKGATRGLAELEVVAGHAQLAEYQPYWAARAELLANSGDAAGAECAYARAIGLETDDAVRRFLEQRRRSLGSG